MKADRVPLVIEPSNTWTEKVDGYQRSKPTLSVHDRTPCIVHKTKAATNQLLVIAQRSFVGGEKPEV